MSEREDESRTVICDETLRSLIETRNSGDLSERKQAAYDENIQEYINLKFGSEYEAEDLKFYTEK